MVSACRTPVFCNRGALGSHMDRYLRAIPVCHMDEWGASSVAWRDVSPCPTTVASQPIVCPRTAARCVPVREECARTMRTGCEIASHMCKN